MHQAAGGGSNPAAPPAGSPELTLEDGRKVTIERPGLKIVREALREAARFRPQSGRGRSREFPWRSKVTAPGFRS